MTGNTKQFSQLISPLQKIQEAAESNNVVINQIAQIVLSINKNTMDTVLELKKQTTILGDIRSILKGQNKSLEKGAGAKGGPSGGMFSPMSAKDIGLTAMMILGVAGAIVGAAALFTLVPVISIGQLLTVLAVAGIFTLIAPTFVKIADILGKNSRDIIGAGTKKYDVSNPKSMFALAGLTALSMMAIAITLVISGAIFALMPTISGAQFLTALAIAVIMVPAAFAFMMIMKAIKGATNKELVFGAIAIPLIALGLVGAAYAFMLFPDDPKSPDPLWTLKSAFAIGLFAIGFYFIMKAIKGANVIELIYGGLAIPIIAIALVGVAYAFMLFPKDAANLAAPDPLWTLKSAFAIGLFAIGFYFIMKAIKGANVIELIYGGLAIPIIAIGLLAVAWIFQGLSAIKEYLAPEPMWVLKAGFALLIFAIPFFIVSKAIKGMGPKELLFMTLAIPVVAFGVLATAWIFQGLSGIEYFAPEPEWVLKSGLAIVIFGAVIWLSSKTIGKMSAGKITKALIGVAVAAFAIIIVAQLFQYLPSTFTSPPSDWSIAVGAALGVFGVAIAAVGIAVSTLTPVTLLLGALGIIVIAIVIVAVGWILAGLAPVMPKLKTVANGFVDIMLAPVRGIISVFKQFKDDIGIENMIPLAVGVAALGGAWLIFSAAVAGGSVASLLGAAAGAVTAIFDGIGKLFGGKNKSPLDILKELAIIGPKVQTLANPLLNVGIGFTSINASAGGVIKAFEAAVKFSEIDSSDFKSNATSFRSISNSYIGIAKASKAMNIKAIDASTNMFKALTDLAKSGAESAMSVLAEKLMLAVKELTGAAKNLEDSVNTQGNATNTYTDVISKTMNKVGELVTGTKKTTGAPTPESKDVMDIKQLIAAITQLEERFDTAIKVRVVPGETF